MADFDVIVIGGGPGGFAAAIKAAEAGAAVALIEAEKPGGACVHYACIPTNILLDSAINYVEARSLAALGVFEAGQTFNFGRAVARKDALVRQLADGVTRALRTSNVTVIAGRAAFVSPSTVEVLGPEGKRQLSAEAFVIATGTRWEPPSIPGVPTDRVLTADAVQRLAVAPESAVVLGGGPAGTAFAVEYAALLAIGGGEVAFVAPGERLVPALDGDLDGAAATALTDLGVSVFYGAACVAGGPRSVTIAHQGGSIEVPGEIVVAADARRPYFETLNLGAAGVEASDRVPVGRDCRTNVPRIFGAGDVTGGPMLASAAAQMGEVAGVNAAGGHATTRPGALPHVLHTLPGIAWVGRTEVEARAEGFDVACGMCDLSFNPRSLALGARPGMVKVVAERSLGEILGVHVVGSEASELVGIAAAAMQGETTLAGLASMTFSHPSMAEALVDAARQALR
jgi:dihydrolipoamide dehydrogenase